jgi:hypothetical protein
MAPVLKTGIPERVSGVRIPHSPPFCREILSFLFSIDSYNISLAQASTYLDGRGIDGGSAQKALADDATG